MRIGSVIRAAVAALLLAAFAAPAANADAPAAHYTYRGSNCAKYSDPLNVRWFNIDWLGVRVGLEQYMPKWGTLAEWPGSGQYAVNYATRSCEAGNYSTGRQWGKQVAPLVKKYKFHARLFTTGIGQVATGAHLERKVSTSGCSATVAGVRFNFNDAVYRNYNGKSGFDAGMEKIAAAYRAHSSSDVRIVRSRSPFTNQFKQCNGEVVVWSGRVAYITRPGP